MTLFKLLKKKSKKDAPKTKEEANVYTNIFEKPSVPSEKSIEQKEEDSQLISSVFTKQEEETGEKKNILGALPELEQKIVGTFDPSKRNLKIIRTAFISLAILAVFSMGFFYAELNPDFDLLSGLRGPNTAQKFNNSQQELISAQTSINQKNYLLLNYYLTELSYLADTYTKARNDNITVAELTDLQNQILLTYENAQTKWNEPMVVADIPKETFEEKLKAEFREELTALSKETPSTTTLAQINDYRSTLKLIGNNRLNSFFSKNTDDIQNDLPKDDTKLFALTNEVLTILDNDFSAISDIKQDRVMWSIIVNEIEKVTKSVDTLYNTGFFEELGGIQYAAYDFDASTNRIILTGKAKRDDGTTFSLVTDLMDALEKSSLFSNVDNRSFPKSGSQEEGYLSTFRIELTLAEDYTSSLLTS